jgi:hypothetical protein
MSVTSVAHYFRTVGVFIAVASGSYGISFAGDGNSVPGAAGFHGWAASPPMGWNSWDCFGTTLTEAQARSQADAMARLLKPYGWNILTVDIQWSEGASQGHGYQAGAPLRQGHR